jgi:hypothetical protein
MARHSVRMEHSRSLRWVGVSVAADVGRKKKPAFKASTLSRVGWSLTDDANEELFLELELVGFMVWYEIEFVNNVIFKNYDG